MSAPALKWTLWLLAMCTAPLPYMLGGLEIAPPLRLFFFTSVIAALQVTEGPGGWVWNTFLAMGVVQTTAWAVGLYAAAALLARAGRMLPPRLRLALVAALTVATVAVTASVPLYKTPMSSESPRSTLLQVLA